MGTDIHCVVEYREPGRPEWERFARLEREPRNYKFFGELAGVWGDADGIARGRGIPDDRSRWWRWDSGNSCLEGFFGDHSFSWCNAEELAAAAQRAGGDVYYLAVANSMRTLEGAGCEVRMIFGFDS